MMKLEIILIIIIIIIILNHIFFFHSYNKDKIKPKEKIKNIQNNPPPQNTQTVTPTNSPDIDLQKWKREMINEFDECYCLGELLIIHDSNQIFYGHLLNCVEWRLKRLEILIRDGYMCRDCGNRHVSNHIHHEYYIKNKFPWEIDKDALVTLCRGCHYERHNNRSIPVYSNSSCLNEVSREYHNCVRCGGTGYLPQFSHVQNGICFLCMGNLVSKSVFKFPLETAFRNLNSFNERMERNKYIRYINNISEDDFIKKFPNYKQYFKHESLDDFMIGIDDDLPF